MEKGCVQWTLRNESLCSDLMSGSEKAERISKWCAEEGQESRCKKRIV